MFLALFYTAAREIPTLLYTSSLKKVALSGGASPYSPLEGVPPPPLLSGVTSYVYMEVMIFANLMIFFSVSCTIGGLLQAYPT